jgi:hypothetical protein
MICWNTAAVDNHSKEHEAYAGEDLDHTDDEFNLFN